MTSTLFQAVTLFCRQHALLGSGDIIVVGVSGGADSLCLLYVLRDLCRELRLAPPTVAHLNHQLRGVFADEDEAFVQGLARQLSLPVITATEDVAALASSSKQSFEQAARQARYQFLGQVAAQVNATKVAVGHTADDQAETILMHILRGTGLNGLRGMRPLVKLSDLLPEFTASAPGTAASPLLIRPLLETTRHQTEQFCREQGLEPRQDKTNLDTTYFRNRIRHELVPMLQQYNPNIRDTLNRLGQIVAADADFITAQRDVIWSRLVVAETAAQIDLDLSAWQQLPLAMQRATLQLAAQKLASQVDIGFVHLEQAIDILQAGHTGSKVTLPGGLTVAVGYHQITLYTPHAPKLPPDQPLLPSGQAMPVTIPGVCQLSNSEWQLAVQLVNPAQISQVRLRQSQPWEAFLDASIVGAKGLLRARQPGDYFYPLGLEHRQTVKEFLINAKVPAEYRAQLPILVTEEDKMIAWICGYQIDQRARITEKTTTVAHFLFEKSKKI